MMLKLNNPSASVNMSYRDSAFGVFLVSDGGTTLSSTTNTDININNPNAPVNSQSEDVNSPAPGLLAGLCLLMALRIRTLWKNN